MPKRSPEERAAASDQFHRFRIQRAYEGGVIDAPLAAVVDWAGAVLKQLADDDPDGARDRYDHLTRQLATYVTSLRNKVPARLGG